jgi:hypothetical protein
MTILRIKSPDWAVNEKLTSAQQNALDTNVANALDKRSGQIDDLASVITVRSTGALNCLSGATVSFASGSIFTVSSGTIATIAMNSASSMSFAASSSLTMAASSTLTVGGTYSFGAASAGTINNTLHLSGTATLTADINSNIALNGILTSSNLSVSTINGSVTYGASGTLTTNAATVVTLAGPTTAANLTMTSTNRLKLASRALTRTVCTNFVPATSGWSLQSDSLGTPVTTSNTNQYGAFNLSLPDGAVINSLIVWIEGGAGHAGAPANLPAISLFYKQISSGGTGSVLSTKTDTYVSAPVYEAVHGIQLTSISHTVVRNLAKLAVYVQSESGANALSGLKIHGMDVTYTTTSMDDGPCN